MHFVLICFLKIGVTLQTILWNLFFLISNAYCINLQVSLELIHLELHSIPLGVYDSLPIHYSRTNIQIVFKVFF